MTFRYTTELSSPDTFLRNCFKFFFFFFWISTCGRKTWDIDVVRCGIDQQMYVRCHASKDAEPCIIMLILIEIVGMRLKGMVMISAAWHMVVDGDASLWRCILIELEKIILKYGKTKYANRSRDVEGIYKWFKFIELDAWEAWKH